MSYSFYVGQKVICIDDSKLDGYAPPVVKKGSSYIIRSMCTCVCGNVGLDIGAPYSGRMLQCIKCGRYHEPLPGRAHGSHRFRPLLGQEQDQLNQIEQDQLELSPLPVA